MSTERRSTPAVGNERPLPDPYAGDHQPDINAFADLIWALDSDDRQRLMERLGTASQPAAPPIDVERLRKAIADELTELWGDPSDAISFAARPTLVDNIVTRYARQEASHE